MSYTPFDAIQIGIASPDMIRSWSHGEVKKPETINYRTLKPERDGLYCERIFGPTKDWECHCGKYKKIRYKGKVCDRCGVEVTRSNVRRERMGHIELASPVSHIWYFKGIPSRMGLLLDLTPRILEKVLYFGSYIVTDPGFAPLTKGQILSEKEYRDYREKYEDDFDAGMGAEAVKKLLGTVGLNDADARRKMELMDKRDRFDKAETEKERADNALTEAEEAELKSLNGLTALCEQLRGELKDASGQKKAKLIKRLEVAEAFRLSGNDPCWMVIDVLPVLPADIRPLIQLDGGRFATSDLNDLYRRVINRNNRLKRLLQLRAPDIIVRNEKRMLQEAVDALIDNGRRGRPVTGANSRALKSLSDMLKGKQGRFRQNLLGKRVDYSGRSVIVVGPDLKIYQCGLPKEMAIELFRPFVMKKLVEDGVANNIKSAKKMVDKGRTEVWDALDIVIKDHPVMLNRAPTLHRLGIQAFEPVLVEGRAIRLHPLVCTAFNADFDGDQMAVHVPLSAEAQAEARILMLSANNLLRPQDGHPVTVPTQDMILGAYYLTYERNEQGTGKAFSSPNEAMMAYNEGIVGLHSPIRVRVTKMVDGVEKSKLVNTTVGRIIFNEPVPQELGYVDRTNPDTMFDYEVNFRVGKKQLGDIIDRCISKYGFTVSSEVLDNLKSLGYKYSTRGAITISIADMTVPDEKRTLIGETEKKILNIERQFRRGFITDDERYRLVVGEWEKTTKDVTTALQNCLDEFNPIYMMANSGARGSMNQIRQLAGMRGLMANAAGKTIEIPIKANFREGLSVLEYFISSRGARKGLTDTALRTADSGYLTRRLVDVSQDVIIREPDCGTHEGITVSAVYDKGQVVQSFGDSIHGRYPAENICDPETGEVIFDRSHLLMSEDAAVLEARGIHEIKIRSVLSCDAKSGVCARCYGINLAVGQPVNAGEAVGVIAAQSIGEPGTQLTMRTFHTGGIAGDDITQGLPRVEELFEARKPKKMAQLAEISGRVSVEETKKNAMCSVTITNEAQGETVVYQLPYASLLVTDGQMVEQGDKITPGAMSPHDVLRVCGLSACRNYLIQEVQKVYRQQGVDINDKHIEVIVRQMMRKVRVEESGSSQLLSGSVVDVSEFKTEYRAVKARIEAGEEGLVLPTYTQILMGITKASLATESFLSAASFQETTRVLTDAAIKGKVDHLVGLKENVIIGKLIPAGSGLAAYRNFDCKTVEKETEEPENNVDLSALVGRNNAL